MNPAVPQAWARSAAEKLAGFWGVPADAYSIAGAIRRECAEVGEIVLVAPVPAAGVGGARDELFFAIERRLCPPPGAGLFAEVVPAGKLGWAVKGFTPGFRDCQLLLTFAGAGPNEGKRMRLPVEIYRYDAGPEGNRGWIELGRTGPREFGIAFLTHWRRRWALPEGVKASSKGYLRGPDGRAIATPTERACFELAGLEWIPPERREGSLLAAAAAGGGA